MAWYNFRKNRREKRAEETTSTLEDLLLKAGLITGDMDKEKALNIPTVAACTGLISDTIAAIPIKLYQEKDGHVDEVKDDIRTKLLNDETGDTLDAFQFKRAIVADYLLDGNGYAYINKQRNKFKSIHYVKASEVTTLNKTDPIFKGYKIQVQGQDYKDYEFLKILRNTDNGWDGKGIIEENNMMLTVTYNLMKYENVLAVTGGNKKGFLEAERKLDKDAIAALKESWNQMYKENSENCVVLNNGIKFHESSATSTEMQLNENKTTNANEICKIFRVPPSLISGDGKANETDYEKFVKIAILPILKEFETALNRDLLLEKEKGSFYFAFDTKEMLKGDIEKRYKAYEIGIKNGFLGVNEVRYEEDKPNIDAFNDRIKLGLQDVLYNTKTGEIYTPNTDKTSNLNTGTSKGGEDNEDRDKE